MKTKFAIITGATGGIGTCFARKLAKAGYHLLLTGRRKYKLAELKLELEGAYRIQVDCIPADLTIPEQLNQFIAALQKLHRIDMLVNCAGFGCRNNFFQSDFSTHQKMTQINIDAIAQIVRQVVPKMVKNKYGQIINVASLSAMLPNPINYYYCASKAFMVSFSECLSLGLKHHNINVQALCPGFVQTDFHVHSNSGSKGNWPTEKFWMKPEEVVSYSLRSLHKNRIICVPGFYNRVIYALSRWLPRTIYYKMISFMLKDRIKLSYSEILNATC